MGLLSIILVVAHIPQRVQVPLYQILVSISLTIAHISHRFQVPLYQILVFIILIVAHMVCSLSPFAAVEELQEKANAELNQLSQRTEAVT